MTRLVTLAAAVSGCAVLHFRSAPATIPIDVRSHNRSEMEVYLLCGDRDAEWLGVVPAEEAREFEVPAERGRCPRGLNFFLTSRGRTRGYWIGPLYPAPGANIALVIEKYAGLSSAATSY